MSSIVCYLHDNFAYIATDTLAISPDDHKPLLFTSKAVYLPHLHTVLAGTGIGAFLDFWKYRLNTDSNYFVSDFADLNRVSSNRLKIAWSWYKHEMGIVTNPTTTIYHFGFSLDENKMKGYMYNSLDDFSQVEISNGFSVKPEYTDNFDLPDNLNECSKLIMIAQRKEQTIKNIGGRINVIQIDNVKAINYCNHTFDDYEEDLKIIISKTI
jgi:hypothetical protein